MKRKILLALILIMFGTTSINSSLAADESPDFPQYTTLREVDKGTFNEYRYYMVRDYFKLKEYFDLKGTIDKTIATSLFSYAKTGYNYLPDSLINQRYLNDLSISVQKGIQTPNSEINYIDIVEKLKAYLESANIQSLRGDIETIPKTGNAPLTVTFRGRLTDPTGTVIPNNNYVWWIDKGGQAILIGRGPSINYTFNEEGNFTVFLGAKSNHKNGGGYTDVLSFQSRTVVEVKEKIASLFININGYSLRNQDEIKFTPEESSYGLLFDATASTPTGGAKFTKTEWDFGNGVTRRYDAAPKLERVIYSREGTYTVVLRLYTNEGKNIEKKFTLYVHNPIATINVDKTDGYIGDKFTFSTKSSVKQETLSFEWNIIDIDNDKILKQTTGNTFTYNFSTKGRFNVQLKVKDMSGEQDTDSEVININSRAPIAEFSYSAPNKSKPNTILLDGTRSYDPDFGDSGKLKYVWTINGEIVNLDNLDAKGAIGYYTFDSIGDHNVGLEVIDPDDMSGLKSQKVKVTSILSVDLFTFPRVVQRGSYIKFVASSANARTFEWDFGDGTKKSSSADKIDYIYSKSGIYNVKLVVRDAEGNTNEITKTVYVGDSNTPMAVISADYGSSEAPAFDNSACNGGAYIVSRVKNITFKGGESINVDGGTAGLSYTWKIGNDKYVSGQQATHKFDELGCFPVRLTIKGNNGKTSSTDTYVKVENVRPTLATIDVAIQNDQTDPVVVNVSAMGAKDEDGVIQSYLWYYYTDTDSDPQDFRITSTPKTTFVLPKVTGNYYFVVVMKDNNDERYSSEEVTGSKYFVSLAGDNINTPLIDFKVDKSSVMIGDEVVFTSKVKNILGQDISDKVEYAWDFDGDGFYDKETNVGTYSFKYNSSGTFYAKVRVKYKGITNVRNLEINVANILNPDFDYISIGSKYLFFNTSSGEFQNVIWDMGDGNKVEDKNSFVYEFTSPSAVNKVDLKIAEGTKVKNITKEVVKNPKNMLEVAKSNGIVIFSNPEITDDKITLDSTQKKAYVYLGSSKGSFKYYGIDFDLSADSDLNGTKDDDIDNKSDISYKDGSIVEIPLNKSKSQTFRVMLIDEQEKVVDSKDITITKSYIQDEKIDLSQITFTGVTESESAKVEKLKSYVQSLPEEYRLKGMQFIQQLQEAFFYPNEKTRVILDFESFIDSTKVTNASDIVDLLESFLVEGQEDQSVRNMAYNVVKNLIPEEASGYSDIIANLDAIKSNPTNLEENKALGTKILESIKSIDSIPNDEKIIIKTQLQVLIYGGVDKIPEEVVKETSSNESTSSNKVIGFVSLIAKLIGIFFGLLLSIVVGFYVWYLTSNKNSNQGFQDFIIEKTSFDKDGKDSKNSDILSSMSSPNNDVLSQVNNKKEPESKITGNTSSKMFSDESKKEESTPSWLNSDATKKIETEEVKTPSLNEEVPDWLKGNLGTTSAEPETEEVKEEAKVEEPVPTTIEEEKVEEPVPTTIEEEVPDWLKGNLGTTSSEEKVEEFKEEAKVEEPVSSNIEEEVPDWLKGSLGTTTTEEKVEEFKEEAKVEEPVPTTIEEEVPDWLKGSLGTTSAEPKTEEVKEEAKVEEPVSTTIEEEVPDWLKGSLGTTSAEPKTEEVKEEAKVEEPVSTTIEEEVPDWLKGSLGTTSVEPKTEEVKEEAKVEEPKKAKTSKSPAKKTTDKKEESAQSEPVKKTSKKSSKDEGVKKTSSEELWNDGMDVPDWLKQTDDKKDKDDFWSIDEASGTDKK